MGGDAILLAVVVGSFAVAGLGLRARLLPDVHGPVARLVEALLAVAALTVVCEALGLARGFRLAPLLVAALLAAVAGVALWRRAREPGAEPAQRGGPAAPDRWTLALAGAAVGVVAVDWLRRVSLALDGGMANVDTLSYHGPYAARFVQDGSFASVALTEPEPLTAFYPANAELLHAVGMLLVGHDTLSPFLNLGWLALAFLAAWCLGRPFGASAAALLAVAVVAGCHLMVWSQAGDATNDTACLALLLSAAALVANAARDSRLLVVAAVPAGLALGTKLSLVAAVLVLFAVVVVLAGPAAHRRVAVAWAALLPLLGGFWYLRNLVEVGNPLPWLKLGVGDLSLPAIEVARELESQETGLRSTFAHLVTRDGAAGVIEAGLRQDLGPAWWAIVACAALGLVAGVATRDRAVRALAVVGLAIAAAYAITPTTAFFVWNVRHALPAVALGLALLAFVPRARTPAARRGVAVALAILFVTTQATADLALTTFPRAAVALAAAAAAAGAALAVAVWPRVALRAAPVLGGALALAAVAAGPRLQERHLDARYADPGGVRVVGYRDDAPLRAVFHWARGVRDARIGVVGTEMQYPLFGLDLSNHVRYVHRTRDGGRVVDSVSTCAQWRRAVADMRLDYVVITPLRLPFRPDAPVPAARGWTRSLPGAREIARHADHVSVFRLPRPLRPGGCARA